MNIVLVGMSGAGKSTLGVLLAKALRMNFVDTDIVLQQREGRKLQEIIDEDGIKRFLEIEEDVIYNLNAGNSVVSTGGSVVYSEKAMKALKHDGKIVYLHVPYEEIEERLGNIEGRGIVVKNGFTLRDVYEERVPLYNMYSDIVYDCSEKDIKNCLSDIVRKIKESL